MIAQLSQMQVPYRHSDGGGAIPTAPFLLLLASHDTYGIKFSVPGSENNDALTLPRAVAEAHAAAAEAASALA